MTELIIFALVWAVIVVNSRREIWKHRARLRQSRIDTLIKLVEIEQEANKKLMKRIPGSITVYKPTVDHWPSEIDE